MATTELVYYRRNVPYTVIVRRNVLDALGVSLNNATAYVAVEKDAERDFKIANKKQILDGLIIPTDAPDIDWETPNALTDDDITNLLKNYLKFKQTLATLDSVATLTRIQEAAKEQGKSQKILTLIEERLDEVSEATNISPGEMQGVR